eukprot:TRINITY_DN3351_c0_g3_i1.p9 TRINITY_DN3351_c0_g3~~TRINITY_DN3351_c0_g3_i1.p9  ORF type:complete len:109 (+),score=1.39 TRINITY_DN3351_c0_g3_i1:1367-1693(+)
MLNEVIRFVLYCNRFNLCLKMLLIRLNLVKLQQDWKTIERRNSIRLDRTRFSSFCVVIVMMLFAQQVVSKLLQLGKKQKIGGVCERLNRWRDHPCLQDLVDRRGQSNE